jgi:hypothetical protein
MAKDFNVYQWRREHLNEDLNENLEIGQEYSKEEVANMFDQIYWRATNKLNKEDILALPFDRIRYFGMYPPGKYSALPNFVSPKGPEQSFLSSDDSIQAQYAADKAKGIKPGLD